MGRLTYVCTACSEHFTRKYSAKRHNYNIHTGEAEIVRLPDYLVGKTSGQYAPSHPFWYKRTENIPHKFRPATVADTVGDTFQLRDGPQQAPLGAPQDSAGLTFRHTHTTGQETKLKIEELKRLVYKYP